MMQQYKDLIFTINIEIKPEDKKKAASYYKIATFLKYIAIIFLFFALICVLFDFKIESVIYMVSLVFIMIYIFYKKINSAKMRNILLKDCDPEGFLSYNTALIYYSNRSKSWDIHFYNICNALYYAGRFEDEKKVLDLYKKYCKSNSSLFKYEILSAKLSYSEMNENNLLFHCNNLERLIKTIHINQFFSLLYTEAMQYPKMLEIENNKDYEQAFNLYKEGVITYYNSMLSKVKIYYFMYKIAKAAGKEDEEEKFRKFILENGGSLFYKKAILGKQ